MASVDIVALAKSIKALPFAATVDFEALLAKAKTMNADLQGVVTAEGLLKVFQAAGIDKVAGGAPAAPAEGEAKGEDAPPPAEDTPAAAPEEGGKAPEAPAADAGTPLTNYAGDLLAVYQSHNLTNLRAPQVLGYLFVCLKGYGEPAFKFATACADLADTTNLSEHNLFAAIQACASVPLDGVRLTHLRRVWRACTKKGSGDDVSVATEEWFEKMGGDETLADLLTVEKPVVTDPPAAPPAEEE